MHILFVTNYLPPVIDGVGDYTYNLALIANGFFPCSLKLSNMCA